MYNIETGKKQEIFRGEFAYWKDFHWCWSHFYAF